MLQKSIQAAIQWPGTKTHRPGGSVAPSVEVLGGKSSEAGAVQSCYGHSESIREEGLESMAPKQKGSERTLLLRFPLGLLHRLSLARQEERS